MLWRGQPKLDFSSEKVAVHRAMRLGDLDLSNLEAYKYFVFR